MLIINQGVQNTKDDNKFEIIKEKGVFGKISEIKAHATFDNTLSVTIDIIDHPKYKGRKVWDTVTYDPTSEYAWKYRSLRRCVGKPYTEGEDPKIDIEKILLNKKVKMNLDVREGNDGNEYQRITYLNPKTEAVEKVAEEVAEEIAEEDISEDVPW